VRQKAERKARDEAIDAAFAQYLAEERKKDIEKQKDDDNARHARSKFAFTFQHLCDFKLRNYPYRYS